MGWFGSDRHVEESVEQAQRLAARMTLPVTARSLTRSEVADRQRNIFGLGALVVMVFLLFALFLVMNEGGGVLAFALVLILIAPLGLFVAGKARMARFAGYRDPRIRIEADGDGVAFTNEAGTQRVDWLDIEARVRFVVGKNDSVTFTGLGLDSPLGAIGLEDDWYRNGRSLAAAIIAGKIRAAATRERDKVGIAPAD